VGVVAPVRILLAKWLAPIAALVLAGELSPAFPLKANTTWVTPFAHKN
jgi:hypothetical protein